MSSVFIATERPNTNWRINVSCYALVVYMYHWILVSRTPESWCSSPTLSQLSPLITFPNPLTIPTWLHLLLIATERPSSGSTYHLYPIPHTAVYWQSFLLPLSPDAESQYETSTYTFCFHWCCLSCWVCGVILFLFQMQQVVEKTNGIFIFVVMGLEFKIRFVTIVQCWWSHTWNYAHSMVVLSLKKSIP